MRNLYTTSEEVKKLNSYIGRNFKGLDNQLLIINIYDEVMKLKPYWPMTLRAYHYRIVAAGLLPNKVSTYNKVSNVLKRLRIDEMLDWKCMEDLTRTYKKPRGWGSVQDFIDYEVDNYLEGFELKLSRSQPNYVEISVEKDTVLSLAESITSEYCTPLSSFKGTNSVTAKKDLADRFIQAESDGYERFILIHYGDLDPSGVQIPITVVRDLANHHGIEIELITGGLTVEQVEDYNLIPIWENLKPSDPNYRSWVKRFGDMAPTELDALHPKDLKDIIKSDIELYYDMEIFQSVVEEESKASMELVNLKNEFIAWQESRS